MSQYLVTSSLNKKRIYIKIIDTSTYLCYEGNFDIDNFKIMMSIKEIYDICLKSFEEGTYNVVFINKFIKLEPFGLILKNTLLSIEQLSINYHKQVFENSVLMNKLEKVCESLEAKISENSVLTRKLEKVCESLETKISENSVLTKRFEKLEAKISENSFLMESENSFLTKKFERIETKISENSELTKRERMKINRPPLEQVLKQATNFRMKIKGVYFFCRTEEGLTFKDAEDEKTYGTLNKWAEGSRKKLYETNGVEDLSKKSIYNKTGGCEFYSEKNKKWLNLGEHYNGDTEELNPL